MPNGSRPQVNPSRGALRVAKDIHELKLQRFYANCDIRISFPEGEETNVCLFNCLICPQDGFWKDGQFLFNFRIPEKYPFSPPRVLCQTKVLHPNINFRSGEVHLPLLKHDWKPVLSINTVIFGLQLLFLEPNLENIDPLNKECIEMVHRDVGLFHQYVRATMRGGWHFGDIWPHNIHTAETKQNSNQAPKLREKRRADTEPESVDMNTDIGSETKSSRTQNTDDEDSNREVSGFGYKRQRIKAPKRDGEMETGGREEEPFYSGEEDFKTFSLAPPDPNSMDTTNYNQHTATHIQALLPRPGIGIGISSSIELHRKNSLIQQAVPPKKAPLVETRSRPETTRSLAGECDAAPKQLAQMMREEDLDADTQSQLRKKMRRVCSEDSDRKLGVSFSTDKENYTTSEHLFEFPPAEKLSQAFSMKPGTPEGKGSNSSLGQSSPAEQKEKPREKQNKRSLVSEFSFGSSFSTPASSSTSAFDCKFDFSFGTAPSIGSLVCKPQPLDQLSMLAQQPRQQPPQQQPILPLTFDLDDTKSVCSSGSRFSSGFGQGNGNGLQNHNAHIHQSQEQDTGSSMDTRTDSSSVSQSQSQQGESEGQDFVHTGFALESSNLVFA